MAFLVTLSQLEINLTTEIFLKEAISWVRNLRKLRYWHGIYVASGEKSVSFIKELFQVSAKYEFKSTERDL